MPSLCEGTQPLLYPQPPGENSFFAQGTVRTVRTQNPPQTKTAFQQQLDAKAAAKKKFLFTFAKVGNVTATCQETGTARRTHYDWLAEDPEYAGRFQDAKIEAAEWLEVEARRRAVTGEVVHRYYKGQKVAGGEYRKRSDMLLWNMLKSLKPDVYDRANYDPSRGRNRISPRNSTSAN